MDNKELKISFEEKLYLKRICEDFKIYCDFWSEFTSKIIFDIETLALIVDYKNEKYSKQKIHGWRITYDYEITNFKEKFSWYQEINKRQKYINVIFEITKSKDSIENKIKEFISKVEFVIEEIKNLEIKSSVYGDKEKIINELEEILTNKDKFFKNSLGI